MPYHNAVRAQGLQRFAGVDQRFTFFHAGSGRADNRSVSAQQLGSEFKRYSRSRGSFIKKKRDPFAFEPGTRRARMHGARQLENRCNVVSAEMFEVEEGPGSRHSSYLHAPPA